MNDKCVVLNAKKMNFDGKLDFSVLSSDVTVYDDTTEQQLSECIQGADIIVTKEMPVSAEMIQKFPESVKLYFICRNLYVLEIFTIRVFFLLIWIPYSSAI